MKQLFMHFKRIFLQENIRNYSSGIIWLFVSQIIGIINTLTVGIWVIRHLGPEKFGTLNYAISFASVFFMFFSGTGDPLISQTIIRFPQRTKEILGTVSALYGGMFILLFSISVIFSYCIIPDYSVRKLCLIISFAYSSYIFQILHPYFQATVQAKRSGISFSLAAILYAMLRLIAVLTDAPLEYYAWCEAIMHISSNIFLLIAYLSNGGGFKFKKESLNYLKPFLKPCIMVSCCSLISIIYVRTNILMLEYFSGNEAVGLYSLAAKISDIFNSFIIIVLTTLFPAVIKGYEQSRSMGDQQLHKLCFSLFYLILIAALGIALLAQPMIRLLFGEKFIPSAEILQITIFSLPVIMLLSVYYNLAIYQKMIAIYIITIVAELALNVVGNIWLIPRFGIIGAAYSFVFSLPLGMLIAMPLSIKSRKIMLQMLKCIVTVPVFK